MSRQPEGREPEAFTVGDWVKEARDHPERAMRRMLATLEASARVLRIRPGRRDDLTQEAALRALVFARSGSQRHATRPFRSWVERILRNADSEARRRVRREIPTDPNAFMALMPGEKLAPEEHVVLRETREWLRMLAALLPVPHGELVRLLILERVRTEAAVRQLMEGDRSLGRRGALRLIRETRRLLLHCFLGGTPESFHPIRFRGLRQGAFHFPPGTGREEGSPSRDRS